MGFLLTEKWSGTTAQKGTKDSSGAARIWEVSGTGGTIADQNNALTASGGGKSVANINDAYYDTTAGKLNCKSVVARRVSLNLIEVTEQYAVGQFNPPNANPLLEPETIGWSVATQTEDVDHDIDGLPYLNLCGSVMTGGKRTFYTHVLKIVKNVAMFDLALAMNYENTVNDESLTITTGSSSVTIPKGFMRVASVIPTKTYKLTDTYVPVETTLEIADANSLDHPFQSRMIHMGYEAYCQESGDDGPVKGRIVLLDSKQPVSHPVRLDENGVPMESGTYGVKRDHGKPISSSFVTSPVAAGISGALEIPVDTSSSSDCVYIIRRKCDEAHLPDLFTALSIT